MRLRSALLVGAATAALGLLPASGAMASTKHDVAPSGSGLLSTDPTQFLAAIGETPQEFLATGGGVTLAQLHTQLVDQAAGLPIPNYANTPQTSRPATSVGQLGVINTPTAVSPTPDAVYNCNAYGSNEFEGSGGSTTRGFARLGFQESCNNPEGTVSSSCVLSGVVNGKTFQNSASGNDTCFVSTLVGIYNVGTTGGYHADWGGYNSAGVPFTGLAGCVTDGTSASCRFDTSFTVGHNNMFALVADGG